MVLEPYNTVFAEAFNKTATTVHAIAVEKGWWEGTRNEGELIALMHSELSEALEGLRHGNPHSEHISEFSAVEEEFADVLIRIMDHAMYKGYRVGEAVEAKIKFNASRAYKHGGKAF
jgi:NTP pyrophosphatase (non-canonical NTP hydrolase)